MSAEKVPRHQSAAASPTTRGRPSPWTRRCSRWTPIWGWLCWRYVGLRGTGWALPGHFSARGRDTRRRSRPVAADQGQRAGAASAAVARLRRPGSRRPWMGAIRCPRRSGACRTAGIAVRGHDPTRARRRPRAAALRPRRHHRRGQSTTSVRTTLDKPDPDGLLGDEFTLRDLRLAHEADRRDGRCSATPSGARWSRISSPLGKRRSAPEGVPQRCSGGTATQSRLGTEAVRCLVAFTGVDEMASRAGRIQGCGG